MLKTLLSSLVGYKTALLSAMFLAVVVALGVQSFRLDRAQTAVTVLISKNESLVVQIDAQNIGIKSLEVASKARAVAADKAALVSKSVIARAERKALALEAMTAPIDCNAAIELLVLDAKNGGVL